MALPGINTVIKDRFYSLSRINVPLGARVLAIAQRTTDDDDNSLWPNLDPYVATREDDVIAQFGEGSPLHRAFIEINSGGAQRILLVALPSDTVFTDSTGSIDSDWFDDQDTGIDLFDAAFAAAEAAQPDVIVPWGRGGHSSEYGDEAATVTDTPIGFYANNSVTPGNSWAVKVSDKMAEITANSNPCFAVLGIKPYAGPREALTPGDLVTHLGISGLVSRADENHTHGNHLVVVATEVIPVGYEVEWGYANGATTFAAQTAQLNSWSSPTAKSVLRIQQLRYGPTRAQQQILIDKGIVPVAVDYSRDPIWVDAMTFSKATSDYTRLTTLRIVFDAVQMVRQVAQKFIGEASSLSQRNALDTAISAGLRGMMQAGALLSADFDITYIGTENKAIVDLVLNPAFELRNIEVRISVQL